MKKIVKMKSVTKNSNDGGYPTYNLSQGGIKGMKLPNQPYGKSTVTKKASVKKEANVKSVVPTKAKKTARYTMPDIA